MMKCSLIIPCFNAENTIKYTLNSILNQRIKPDEIIIVYAASKDETFKIIKNYIDVLNIKVIEINPSGPARSRNIGIKYSKSDLLVFIDADCVIPADYIEKVIYQFNNENLNIAGCSIRGYLPNTAIEYYLSEYGLALPKNEKVFETPEFLKTFIHTASLSCRKKVFDKVGLFDEKLLTGEDHDFCYRALKSGFKIHFFTGFHILHKFSGSFQRFIKQTFSFSFIHSYLLQKHFKKRTHIYLSKKKYILNFIKFPLIINLNNITFKVTVLILLALINKYFIILLFLWLFKLFISLNRRFSKKYNISKIKIIHILFIHLIYNAISLIGQISGVIKNTR